MVCTFAGGDGGVTVDPHDQPSAQRPALSEGVHVAVVHHIEGAFEGDRV
jgi:hypothetical protein